MPYLSVVPLLLSLKRKTMAENKIDSGWFDSVLRNLHRSQNWFHQLSVKCKCLLVLAVKHVGVQVFIISGWFDSLLFTSYLIQTKEKSFKSYWGIDLYHTIPTFKDPEKEKYENSWSFTHNIFSRFWKMFYLLLYI